MKSVDMISLVEAAYRLDLDLRGWMRHVAQVGAPELDSGFGVVFWLMRFPGTFRTEPVGPVEVVGGPAQVGAVAHAVNTNLDEEAVRKIWLCATPFRSGTDLIDDTLPIVEPRVGRGTPVDAVGLTALDGEGFALSVAGPVARGLRTSAAARERWAPFAPHLAAGFRLRRRLMRTEEGEAGVEAVFTPDGKCVDAAGAATGSDARTRLRDAVKDLERLRGPLRRKRPEEALSLWRGLVAGTWSLVDSFSSDGKRFIVARRNEPQRADPRALSERERQVISFAASGETNKNIGYRLGLATSTVGSHLSSAARKLQITNRSELSRLHAIHSDAAEVRRLELGGETLSVLSLGTDHTLLARAGLTPTEQKIANEIVGGASNSAIARARGTAERTVANQVAALFRKLGVASRSELVAKVSAK